jgi:capsular exopolysaccharide synthesis family protein
MIRILVADDQKSIREILRLRLEAEPDFEVVGTASDGYTAIEMAEILHPDIVLIDMEMPGLNGVEATKLICQSLPNIKVLVLSAHNDDQYIVRALHAGAMGYLLKSTPAEELQEAIRFTQRGYSQLSPGVLNKLVLTDSSALQTLAAQSVDVTPHSQKSITKPTSNAPIKIDFPVLDHTSQRMESQSFEDFTGLGVTLWRIIRQRWLPATIAAGSILGVTFIHTFILEEPLYRSEIWIQVSNKSSVPVTSLPKDQTDLDTNDDVSKGRLTEVQILRSSPLISKAIKQLPKLHRGSLSIQDIRDNLSITQAEEDGLLSNVLIVDYSDVDPQRVYAVLKALGNTYIQHSSETTRTRATSAIRFIEQKLPTTRQRLNQANAEVREFRKRYGMVTPESFAQELEKTKLSISNDIRQANIGLNQAQRRIEAQQRRLKSLGQEPTQATTAAVLGQDKNYQELSNQLREIEIKLSTQQSGLSADHPLIRDLQEQRTRILSLRQKAARSLVGETASKLPSTQPTLEKAKDANTNNILNSLSENLLTAQTDLEVQQAQLVSLRRAQASVEEQFKQLPQLQETYADMQRQVTLYASQLESLLQKLQELNIAAAQETTPWSILQPPILPQKPVSPNILRNTLFGVIFSGMVGLGTALLLERLDQRVKSIKEINELTSLPLLGAVPYYQGSSLHSQDYFRYQEAFRFLAIQLQYLSTEEDVKSLAITSTVAGEGKSTITLELSQTLARLGLKVLLVDANLHQPNLHLLLNSSNGRGLSTIIETEQWWTDCIQATAFTGLDFLAAGPQPLDSLALLQSEKLVKLLQIWQRSYDFVLLDTPPIPTFTDTQSLVSKVDCTILVVGIDCTNRAAVDHSIRLLELSRNRLARLVVNFSKAPGTNDKRSFFSLPDEIRSKQNQSNEEKQSLLKRLPSRDIS